MLLSQRWGSLSAASMGCIKLGSLPVCIEDSVPCSQNLNVIGNEALTPYSQIAISAVLTGRLCEENVDDCVSESGGPRCFNGGQCIDQIGGYSCLCLPGFAGERCEGDINECLSNPCNPRGSLDCIQLINDYTCVCRSAFTGEYSWTCFQFQSGILKNGVSHFPLQYLIVPLCCLSSENTFFLRGKKSKMLDFQKCLRQKNLLRLLTANFFFQILFSTSYFHISVIEIVIVCVSASLLQSSIWIFSVSQCYNIHN